MGTNYYCEHKNFNLHLGKSSAGWVFALHVYPERGIFDLYDWEPLMNDSVIVDEYERIMTPDQMIRIITQRGASMPLEERLLSSSYKNITLEQFLEINHAEPGPENLLRSKIDGVHCVGHGSGTWDLHVGDFS